MFLQPAADTQVLVIARHSSSNVGEEGVGQPAGSFMPEANSSNPPPEQQEGTTQQQQQANTVQPAAPASARRTSTSSSPRSRLTSRAAAPSQPSASNSPRTPRATGKAQKAPAAAAGTAAGAGRQPEPADAAAAKGKSRQSLHTPQGRGLTLPQQQALVQRLQEGEGVMSLLQQDLQGSLAARQQLEEQLQQLCGTGCAERQQQPPDASLQPSIEQGPTTAEEAGFGVGGDEPCSEGGSAEASALALRQQLQEQVQLTRQARQELADLNEVVAAQQQQVADLQTQLQQQAVQDHQQQQHMQALRQELAGAQEQLRSMQALQQQTASTPAACQQQGQQGLLPQQHASAPGAPEEPTCCQHEARCQQLQTILQALLQLLPEAQQWHGMRPHSAAVQRSPRTQSTRQHRPVGLHTLLYPPLAVAAPLQPAAAQGYPRSASAPRCATADSSSSPRHWESRAGAVRCNTSGALTATCSSGGAGRCQDGGLVPTDGRLRPLTYRGPDTGTAGVPVAAASARQRLSADAEQGLLASLRVAPVSARMQRGTLSSARGCMEDAAPGCGGRGPTKEQFSPRRQERADAAAGAQAAGCVSPRRGGGSLLQGSVWRGVPKLALSGLH